MRHIQAAYMCMRYKPKPQGLTYESALVLFQEFNRSEMLQ